MTKKKTARRPIEFRSGRILFSLSDNGYATFAVLGGFKAAKLKEIKRLHAWLGRAIEYLEQKQGDEK